MSPSRLSYPSRSGVFRVLSARLVSYNFNSYAVELRRCYRTRRLVVSPAPSSYDSRRYSSISSNNSQDEGDSSFNDQAEVEAALSDINNEGPELMDDCRTHDTFSSSGSASDALNFARERHVLSTISERTEDSSVSSAGMLQNLLARPASYLSSAAASSAEAIRRSLYGAPPSPTLHTRASTDPGLRPVTPDRPAFRPAPPTGRRAGGSSRSSRTSRRTFLRRHLIRALHPIHLGPDHQSLFAGKRRGSPSLVRPRTTFVAQHTRAYLLAHGRPLHLHPRVWVKLRR